MPDPTSPKAGGLWARLFGLGSTAPTPEETQPAEPSAADGSITPPPLTTSSPPSQGEAMVVEEEEKTEGDAVAAIEAPAPPAAVPVPPPLDEPPPYPPLAKGGQGGVVPAPAEAVTVPPPEVVVLPPPVEVPALEVPAEPLPQPSTPPPQLCPVCQTPRLEGQSYCGDCGWSFSNSTGPLTPAPAIPASSSLSDGEAAMTSPAAWLKNRYQILEMVNERAGTFRYRAMDHGRDEPRPVTVLACPLPEMAEAIEEMPTVLTEEESEEILPTFDDVSSAAAVASPVAEAAAAWPSLIWEKALLEKAHHPALPEIVDYFVHENCEYLVEEAPQGRSLWDAWDDPDTDAALRYGWLKQITQALQALHQAGAIVEGIRPGLFTVTSVGQVTFNEMSNLLPLPLPAEAALQATLYTAPELILSPQEATAQSDLYSFGAMIYALEYLHHDLEEKDFERPFTPFQITERYPDVHPLFFRLINKTFVRDPHTRFPTDEAQAKDPSGFSELLQALDVCLCSFDNLRLDIAAWTTTGMVRTGNEDAFSLLHAVDARQDDLGEYALVLLCDGMGGYEAGEVAAALTIAELRQFLLQQPLFAPLAGKDLQTAAFEVETCKKLLNVALQEANRKVYAAARSPGRGRRGMGCTAEAVYVDSRNVVVGHVGDSRTYHLHQGQLVQLTRDQTLVNRLVELGQLTEAEAENHPRKNELQQAIGGQPEVYPGVYHAKLMRGDWVIVCSDGVSNHINNTDLEKMLTRETASSAEEAARRLINLCILRGATDNATLVVIRAS